MLETAEGNRTNTTGGSEIPSDQNRNHEPPSVCVPAENDDENTRGDDLQSEQHHRSRRGQIGAILLVLGASLLVPLSLSGSVPALLGSVAALLLALGTLGIGTATRGRSV